MEAYCFKCKGKREITDPEEIVHGNNRMMQGVCPDCGGKVFRLMGKAPKVIPEKSESTGGEGSSGEHKGSKSDKSNGQGSRFTTTLAEASMVAFVPKELRTTSTLLQIAKAVTEREWSWPEMEIGDWLDTYLFHTMKQRGIILGGYQVLTKEEADAGS